MSELALLGSQKTITKPFPKWPLYVGRELCALQQVLESNIWWCKLGTETKQSEQTFVEFHDATLGIAVTKRLTGFQASERHEFLEYNFPYTLQGAWEHGWLPQYLLLGD